jgi:hypothetical protein
MAAAECTVSAAGLGTDEARGTSVCNLSIESGDGRMKLLCLCDCCVITKFIAVLECRQGCAKCMVYFLLLCFFLLVMTLFL